MHDASVAQAVTRDSWQPETSYRAKLRDKEQTVSLERSATIVAGDLTPGRLLEQALTRVAQEPHNPTHYHNAARACRQLGRLDEALTWIRRARQQPAGRADPALEKEEGELAVAMVELRRQEAAAAVAAKPDDAAARANLAAIRTELDDRRLSDAKRLLDRYPNDPVARHALGNLLLELGQIDGAISQFQQAQRGPRVRVASLIGLGRCFKAKKLHDLAVAQFNAARIELGAMDEVKKDVVYQLGACFELMGKPDEAIAEYKAIYSEDIGFRDVAEKINAFYSKP
jgi:tetratricopeptide (TPR) repeat protein